MKEGQRIAHELLGLAVFSIAEGKRVGEVAALQRLLQIDGFDGIAVVGRGRIDGLCHGEGLAKGLIRGKWRKVYARARGKLAVTAAVSPGRSAVTTAWGGGTQRKQCVGNFLQFRACIRAVPRSRQHCHPIEWAGRSPARVSFFQATQVRISMRTMKIAAFAAILALSGLFLT